MAEKGNKPKVRFKGFSDEWVESTIGDIGSFYYGKSAPKWSLDDNAPTPCVRYGELYTKFGATITKTFSRTNIGPQNLRFSKGGEILVPRVGEKPEDFGKCCCFLTLKNIAIGEMISVFETTQDPLFYTYYFRNLYKKFAKAVEGKNVKNLYYKELEPIQIFRSSLIEQAKIGTFFKNLDNLITQHQREHDKLTQIKKSMLEKMFPKEGADVPEIRFKGFSDKWRFDNFKNLTNINQGLQIAISERFSKKIKGSYFYITNEFLKDESDTKYYILNPPESVICNRDDILMTRTGNTGQIVTNVSGAFHNNFFKIKYKTEILSKDFLVYFLRLEKTQSTILRMAGTSTIPDLNHNDFYKIKILYPSIKEQDKIAEYFKNIDNLINLQQQELEKLKNIKKACLEKMFVS